MQNEITFSSRKNVAPRAFEGILRYQIIPPKSGQGVLGEGWTEIREMLFDDAIVKLADTLEEKGIAAPDEAGYELANDSGEVIAEIELAWTGRKVGYMTEEQTADRENAENAGWTIFTTAEEIDTVSR